LQSLKADARGDDRPKEVMDMGMAATSLSKPLTLLADVLLSQEVYPEERRRQLHDEYRALKAAHDAVRSKSETLETEDHKIRREAKMQPRPQGKRFSPLKTSIH
jgi:hypothetical protein